MALGVYLNFKGNTKQALGFYEQVFNVKCNDLKTMADMPSSPDFVVTDEMKDMVINASLVINDTLVMFSDASSQFDFVVGNNVMLNYLSASAEEITDVYNKLSENATIIMPLGPTFFSPNYGYLIDQFGIGWQLNQQ